MVTQSNLWATLAYSLIRKSEDAGRLMVGIESARYDQDRGLFNSHDCKDNTPMVFFSDDQALAILTYVRAGEGQKARTLAGVVLESPLYDTDTGLFNRQFSISSIDTTKSTYKNSIMAFALGALGYNTELEGIQRGLVRDLYDPEDGLFCQTTRDGTKVPDNSALALVALEIKPD